MHMIECTIRPSALEKVIASLASLGVFGCTALECKGFGKQKGHTQRYRGGRMDVGFVPKVLLKVAVKSEDLEKVVESIVSAARTGQVGDGKLFVYELSNVVRVRTGDKDNDAL